MNWKSEVLGEVLSEVFAQHLTHFHPLSTKDFLEKKWGDEVIKRLRRLHKRIPSYLKRLRGPEKRLFFFEKSLQIFLQSLLLLIFPFLLYFFTYTMEHFFLAYEKFVPQAGNKNCLLLIEKLATINSRNC